MADERDEVAAFWQQVQREEALANPGPRRVIAGGKPAEDEPVEPLFDPESIRLGSLDWLDVPPPEQDWLLEQTMPAEEIAIFGGAGASSKSQLLLQTAVGVAAGAPIADGGLSGPLWRPFRPRPVLMLTAEDKDTDIRRRLWRIVQHGITNKAQREWLLAHLYVHSVRGMDVRTQYQERRGGEYIRTRRAREIEALAAAIPDLGLIVLEPVSRFRGGDELDNTAATAQVAWMERLSQAVGCNVATTAHFNKFANNNLELNQDSIRGASGLVDGARWVCAQRVMSSQEADKYHVPQAERRKWVQVAVVKANNVETIANKWVERGSGGYLLHRSLKAGTSGAVQGADKSTYEAVVDWVCELVKARPEEAFTVNAIEARYGGKRSEVGPGVGEKRLRQYLNVALEDGGRLRRGAAGRLVVVEP